MASSIEVEPIGARGRPLIAENSVLLPDSKRPIRATFKAISPLLRNFLSD